MVRSFDIVSFGSAVVDTFVSTNAPMRAGKFCYEMGSKYLVTSSHTDVGGGGTNTAVAFSRLGLRTGCVCGVGSDSNGKEILNLLKKEGVYFLGSVGSGKTGYSVILDSVGSGRTILTYKGESNNVGIGDIVNFKSDWLYFSSLLAKSFVTQKKLAKKMVRGGTRLAFNPSSYHIRKMDIRDILKITHVLILNKEEAGMLARRYGRQGDVLKALCSFGPSIIVVTDKDRLIMAYDGNKKYRLKPNKVKVVERTGAGDAFASGFVAGLVAGRGIMESMKLGLREGESVIRYFGAKNKLLRMKIK